MSKPPIEIKCFQSVFLLYHRPQKIALLLSIVVEGNAERLVNRKSYLNLCILTQCSEMSCPVLCLYLSYLITKLSKLKGHKWV